MGGDSIVAKLRGKLCGDATLQFSFNHGCLCARFNVTYKVYDSNGKLVKSMNYGAINLNGTGNIIDSERNLNLGFGCWDNVKFKFACLSAGDLNYDGTPCSISFSGVGCHNGATGTFKVNGEEVSIITVDTNIESELDFCQVAGSTSPAP